MVFMEATLLSSNRFSLQPSLSLNTRSLGLSSRSGRSSFTKRCTLVASLGRMETSTPTETEAVSKQGDLPLKEIPGGYGIPFLSPIVNRWRYFYIEGEPAYWETRMKKYDSTVFRTNMPPGWPWTDSRCIMLLDQKSYPTVFDYEKVDKYKAFAGTFMPSTSYNGGLTMCAYLDPSDKKHEQLKQYCFELLKLSSPKWMPEFHKQITNTFIQWENKVTKSNFAKFSPSLDEALFKFLINAMTAANLNDPKILDSEKPVCGDLQLWVAMQLVPVIQSGKPFYVDELLHIAPIPSKVTEKGYTKMVDFLKNYADDSLALGQKFGLDKNEAVHNLVFFLILNAQGGFLRFFPTLLEQVGADAELQAELRAEVQAAANSNGGLLTMKAIMNDMPLVASTVHEALRYDPPVPFQYARAKKDFILESHDARFQIRKGDFLGGANYMASRDPKVFKDEPKKFKAKRFMGPEGEKLLHHLFWSNGRQTDETTTSTKQCAGKEIVPLTGRLLLAEIFMRYYSFQIEGKSSDIGFKTLQQAAS